MMGTISPTPGTRRKRLQNTSMGLGLIELTEPSDTLNYKPFFKHCILQTILHVFLLFICSFYKVVGSQGFISCCRYILSGIAIKAVL